MGWPFRPLPDVNPPPPLGYWVVLDLAVRFGSPDSTIHVQTDVPVHCVLRFSENEPTPIKRTVKTRGVVKQTGTSWVIAGGSYYHQNEAGDTTEHSWTVSNWPAGAPLWYYIDGWQQGENTVSKSILFNSMRPAITAGVLGTEQPLPRLATPTALTLEAPSTPTTAVI